jgi:hypothetical protein
MRRGSKTPWGQPQSFNCGQQLPWELVDYLCREMFLPLSYVELPESVGSRLSPEIIFRRCERRFGQANSFWRSSAIAWIIDNVRT